MNYFEVFGLERRLGVDTGALQREFYELSRQWHPDRQHGASPEEQAKALERSALVNAAYRALRDPLTRVEYLVRLEEGRGTGEGWDARPPGGAEGWEARPPEVKPPAPPELLEEVFEVQEMLAEVRAGAVTDDVRQRLAAERDRLAARRADVEARLAGPLAAAWDAAAASDRSPALAALTAALAERAYLRTVVDDLTAALDGEESHVAHHRH